MPLSTIFQLYRGGQFYWWVGVNGEVYSIQHYVIKFVSDEVYSIQHYVIKFVSDEVYSMQHYVIKFVSDEVYSIQHYVSLSVTCNRSYRVHLAINPYTYVYMYFR
jgi:hypothetical protein